MHILITGGAGYIGSHMARMLVKNGHKVVVIDTLEFGHREAIPAEAIFIQGNTNDQTLIKRVFIEEKIDAIIHFAAYIRVEESVREPLKYLTNNYLAPIQLVMAMKEMGVKYIIFSSTASVYGNPQTIPIPENHPKNPTNPYGLSKWQFEEFLEYADLYLGIKSMRLRYFNASGASLDGLHGEAHTGESHIIPLAIKAAQSQATDFFLYGSDYPTSDGTCVRDYVHIEDLCVAHLQALDSLISGHTSTVYNIGTGIGNSNKELVNMVKKITGKDFPVLFKDRRVGDPSYLVADSSKLKKELGWIPKFSDLETIVSSAWRWHQRNPNGYIST